VATATALTARAIALALRRFVFNRARGGTSWDYIVSGGGAQNRTLMAMLAREVEPFDLRIQTTDDFGLPSSAKEAAAFAVLAYQTWHRRPGNIPSATGAVRAAVLGKVSYP